jgi:hypothetical protein
MVLYDIANETNFANTRQELANNEIDRMEMQRVIY